MNNETVVCHNCGQEVPKRSCCGVGSTYRMTWTCVECIKAGAMDNVFGGIRKKIDDAIKEGKSGDIDV